MDAPFEATHRKIALRLVLVALGTLVLVGSAPASVASARARKFPTRQLAATTWTGTHLFVFGGIDEIADPREHDGMRIGFHNDAALFDPDRGTVRVLPQAPLPPLFGSAAATIRKTVLIAGLSCKDIVQPDADPA